MKGTHLRRARRPRLKLAIGLLGLAICGLGIGLVAADVLEKTPADVRPQEPTTTTMINSSVIEPGTTTTVEPTTTTMPRPAGRVPAPVLKKAAATVLPPSSTTTTTEAPKTPLEIAQSQVGKTGPYAEGGWWCWKLINYVFQGVPGYTPTTGPNDLLWRVRANGTFTASPEPGMVALLQLDPAHEGPGSASHVGLVETVQGGTVTTLERNPLSGGDDVVVRQTRSLTDPSIVGFGSAIENVVSE